MFSPDPVGKVSKFFQKNEDARLFCRCPQKKRKHRTRLREATAWQIPNVEHRTCPHILSLGVGRWALSVGRWTSAFSCENRASSHPYLHLPVTVQSVVHVCAGARDRRVSKRAGSERCIRVALLSGQPGQPPRLRYHGSQQAKSGDRFARRL